MQKDYLKLFNKDDDKKKDDTNIKEDNTRELFGKENNVEEDDIVELFGKEGDMNKEDDDSKEFCRVDNARELRFG
ncbi:11185_t:CDS:2 [Racocetra fulgida]|uniref:11185_t:CDS:1 n=1 Tax=Racocetra fulgida TaxID=60492 RepID=A0A9N9A4C4_9GLOM|nr:11185_t:CDS:2 [Racocetra fulgida]